MKNDSLTIEDFKGVIFPVLKQHIDKFEVAKFRKNTMKGNVLIPLKRIEFKNLKGSYAFKVFERLRGYSTPELVESRIGKVLKWDNYILKLKSTIKKPKDEENESKKEIRKAI